MRAFRPAAAALLLLLAGLAGQGAAARPPVTKPAGAPAMSAADAPAPLPRVPLTIRTAKGKRMFRVEIARTGAEQSRGLMFREKLAPDAGMIFPFAEPRAASFWMKNTVIPLDLIFVRTDGTIARIAANAVPYSLDLIQAGEVVGAVLEIAGGRAAALGIKPGDTVRWAG